MERAWQAFHFPDKVEMPGVPRCPWSQRSDQRQKWNWSLRCCHRRLWQHQVGPEISGRVNGKSSQLYVIFLEQSSGCFGISTPWSLYSWMMPVLLSPFCSSVLSGHRVTDMVLWFMHSLTVLRRLICYELSLSVLSVPGHDGSNSRVQNFARS